MAREKSRVKFYSKYDMSVGFYINRVVNIIENFNTEQKITDINEILELYNIQLFISNKIYPTNWDEQQRKNYTEVANLFSKTIGIFFSEININLLDQFFETLEYDYRDDFWELIEKYNVYEKVSRSMFIKLLSSKKFYLTQVLRCKKIVNYFSDEILSYMESNVKSATILLKYYLLEHGKERERYYFPQELTDEKVLFLFEKYVSDPSANSNYLKLLFESKTINRVSIPDKLKLKAKRKYEKLMETLFNPENGSEDGVKVLFSNEIEYSKLEIEDGTKIAALYSTKWISENLDFPTLLNNFIYLFEFTDYQNRWEHVSRESELGVFEKIVRIKGKRDYPIGIAFEQKQRLAQLQIFGYYKILEQYNVNLEEVIHWFFSNYLKEEFGIQNFCFNPSSPTATYLEKCRNLSAEMESILKQFKIYCEDEEIDMELLLVMTNQTSIKDIPSLISNKYLYPSGTDFETIGRLLFSSQSDLYYIPQFSKEYSSFYGVLKCEDISYDMFEDYQKIGIDWLKQHNLIDIDKENKILFNNHKLFLLHQLYENKVVVLNYFKKYQTIIDELVKMGIAEYSSSLLSKPEQEYYNYLFNEVNWNNGLIIRNKYSHGTQRRNDKENMHDYFILLRIIILIVIKINQELCIKYPKMINNDEV